MSANFANFPFPIFLSPYFLPRRDGFPLMGKTPATRMVTQKYDKKS